MKEGKKFKKPGRSITSLSLFLLLALFAGGGKPGTINSSIKTCDSFVNVWGSTNVNRFELSLNYPVKRIFPIKNLDLGTKENKFYRISVPVNQFDSDNKLMYNDFLKLIKADRYPYIILEIPYGHLQHVFSGMECTMHKINITIDGITRSYVIPGSASHCREGGIYVTGLKDIRLTDFNITPPAKLMGLIKVKDDVLIDFGFVFLPEDQYKMETPSNSVPAKNISRNENQGN